MTKIIANVVMLTLLGAYALVAELGKLVTNFGG